MLASNHKGSGLADQRRRPSSRKTLFQQQLMKPAAAESSWQYVPTLVILCCCSSTKPLSPRLLWRCSRCMSQDNVAAPLEGRKLLQYPDMEGNAPAQLTLQLGEEISLVQGRRAERGRTSDLKAEAPQQTFDETTRCQVWHKLSLMPSDHFHSAQE